MHLLLQKSGVFSGSFLASLAPASGVSSILNPLLYHSILHFQFIAIENFQFSSCWKRLPKVHQLHAAEPERPDGAAADELRL